MAKFETETCKRCGGTGHYSYNQMNGTTCFGCGGAKVTLSKRGVAAKVAFLNSTSKPASEIAVGDLIRTHGKWRKVTVVKPALSSKSLQTDGSWKEHAMLEYCCGEKIGLICAIETVVNSVKNGEELDAKLAAAITAQVR